MNRLGESTIMQYSTRHLCQLFGVSEATIRNWAIEFQRDLSALAKPSDGRHRIFTEDDLAVFALVNTMKKDGHIYEEIHAALGAGQRGIPPELPPREIEALLSSENTKQMVLQVQNLRDSIAKLEKQREELAAQVRPLEDENVRLRALREADERRVAEMAAQLKAAQEEIKQLNREIGRLESQMEGKD